MALAISGEERTVIVNLQPVFMSALYFEMRAQEFCMQAHSFVTPAVDMHSIPHHRQKKPTKNCLTVSVIKNLKDI